LNAKEAGSKGGKTRTKLKGETARANGTQGGRPPTKTLVERLLRRSIHPDQQKYIDEALSDMLSIERLQLKDYFQVETEIDKVTLNSSVWRTKSRRVPARIRYLIKKFRLAANHYLRELPPPKPYSLEYRQRDPGVQRQWEVHHSDSGVPCPPTKVRIDVRGLPSFNLIELRHKGGMVWTVKDILEAGGGKWTKKHAEVAIKWLNATYPPGDLRNHTERQGERAPSHSDEPPVLADDRDIKALPDIPWD